MNDKIIDDAIVQFANGGDDTPYWRYTDEGTIGVFVADDCLMCFVPAVEKEIGEPFAKMLCDIGGILTSLKADMANLTVENERLNDNLAISDKNYLMICADNSDQQEQIRRLAKALQGMLACDNPTFTQIRAASEALASVKPEQEARSCENCADKDGSNDCDHCEGHQYFRPKADAGDVPLPNDDNDGVGG